MTGDQSVSPTTRHFFWGGWGGYLCGRLGQERSSVDLRLFTPLPDRGVGPIFLHPTPITTHGPRGSNIPFRRKTRWGGESTCLNVGHGSDWNQKAYRTGSFVLLPTSRLSETGYLVVVTRRTSSGTNQSEEPGSGRGYPRRGCRDLVGRRGTFFRGTRVSGDVRGLCVCVYVT